VIGDGALRPVGADVLPTGPPVVPCIDLGLDPEQWQELEEYWEWLYAEVYQPVFGVTTPDPACEVGIVLTEAPSQSVLVGPEPDEFSPEAGPEIYHVTDQVRIVGHRVTRFGALRLFFDVVHYVPVPLSVEDLPEGWPVGVEVPEVGAVAGVLRSADGTGQPVAVMGLAMTLHLEPPEADTEVGCCLPNGTSEIMSAAECLSAGGTMNGAGQLGDGDGWDDACAYAVDQLTFLGINMRISNGRLCALEEIERTLRAWAGVPGLGPFTLGGAETMGADCAADGFAGAAGWPDTEVPAEPGEPDPQALAACVAAYNDCMKGARELLDSRLTRSWINLGRCAVPLFGNWDSAYAWGTCAGANAIAWAARYGRWIARVGQVLSRVLCIALGMAAYAWQLLDCVDRFLAAREAAKEAYLRDKLACYQLAVAMGCAHRIPVPK